MEIVDMDESQPQDDFNPADQNSRASGNRLKSYCSSAGMSQKDLRDEIKMVQRDASLPPGEKARKIQALMTSAWRKSQRNKPKRTNSMKAPEAKGASKGSKSSEEVVLYYRNKEKGMLGCQHYERRACISAPCCDEFFPCRFCHDEHCDHQINRYEINRFRCMLCGTIQPPSQNCVNCKVSFARYFCDTCRFLDDDPDKHIYHCPDCNLCRIGRGLGIDYFHCKKCNACMSVDLKDHKCVERSLESNCPVCHEYMFTSTIPVMFLDCGHCMHVECYDQYTKTNYVCPVCSKSLGDMSHYFDKIEESLNEQVLPEEYRDLKNKIFCADCERRSVAKFHFLYHKCQHCKSYNTKVIGRHED